MAKYRVFYWKHIPAMVQAEEGGRIVRAQLAQRFQIAIDEFAMATGETGTEAYAAAWRRGPWIERPGPVEDVAHQVVEELERQFGTRQLNPLSAVK